MAATSFSPTLLRVTLRMPPIECAYPSQKLQRARSRAGPFGAPHTCSGCPAQRRQRNRIRLGTATQTTVRKIAQTFTGRVILPYRRAVVNSSCPKVLLFSESVTRYLFSENVTP